MDNVELRHGWNLESAPRVEAFVQETTDEIYWGAKVYAKANYNSEHQKNSFVEGLWKQDALELFVRDLNSNYYQEFNLSPAGAYWSAVFKDYREPAESHERKIDNIEINSKVDDSSWTASMRISKRDLGIDSDGLLINMTAILNTIDESCYLSMLPISTNTPDFHKIIFS